MTYFFAVTSLAHLFNAYGLLSFECLDSFGKCVDEGFEVGGSGVWRGLFLLSAFRGVALNLRVEFGELSVGDGWSLSFEFSALLSFLLAKDIALGEVRGVVEAAVFARGFGAAEAFVLAFEAYRAGLFGGAREGVVIEGEALLAVC